MNAEQLIALMNDLPDDMIDRANSVPIVHRRKPFYLIPAAAACLIAGVTAIVYPKLRLTPPETIEPAVTRLTAETSSTNPTALTEPTAGTAYVTTLTETDTVTADSGTVTVQTHASAVTTAAENTVTAAKTTKTAQAVSVTASETESPQVTVTQTSSMPAEWTNPETTVPKIPPTSEAGHPETTGSIVTQPSAVTAPVWKETETPCAEFCETDPMFMEVTCRILTEDDLEAWLQTYGKDRDFSESCILHITVRTNHTDVILTDVYYHDSTVIPRIMTGEMTDAEKCIHFFIPVPKSWNPQPDSISVSENVLSEAQFQQFRESSDETICRLMDY